MQFSRTGVSIVDGRETMATDDIVKVSHERREVLWVDGSILNHGHRFGISGYVREQAQCSFAQIPHAVLIFAPNDRIMVPQAGSVQFGFKLRGDGGNLL